MKKTAKINPTTLSYWEASHLLEPVDFTIIGGGLVGMFSAYFLRKRFQDCSIRILERSAIPFGASTRNAGFACFGSITELLDDLEHMPAESVWSLVEERYKGLQSLRTILGDAPLDYQACGGFEVFKPEEKTSFNRCLDNLDEMNLQMKHITGDQLTYRMVEMPAGLRGFDKAILNISEGALNTGLMVKALQRKILQMDIQILNGINVDSLGGSQGAFEINTDQYIQPFRSKELIVANNGFARQLVKGLDLVPARNHVLITRPLPGLKLNGTFHHHKGYIYFRNVGTDRLLLGGARHIDLKAEQSDQFEHNDDIKDYLMDFLEQHFVGLDRSNIASWWTGVMGIGKDKTPIVRRSDEGYILAIRLGGMGVALAARLAERAAELAEEIN